MHKEGEGVAAADRAVGGGPAGLAVHGVGSLAQVVGSVPPAVVDGAATGVGALAHVIGHPVDSYEKTVAGMQQVGTSVAHSAALASAGLNSLYSSIVH
jgi:hypothetical protein